MTRTIVPEAHRQELIEIGVHPAVTDRPGTDDATFFAGMRTPSGRGVTNAR
ncbi:hypothetical protein [Streptomyces sp. NPDC008092]|uniref:hypothetical protein n=1 Tax=Streptomyces sp. NPDC008092 TaxID=3364808 RepID=UPI0036ED6A19